MDKLKQNATNFLTEVIKGNIAQAYDTYMSKNCIHHNPYFKGDIRILQKGMEDSHTQSPNKVFEVKHVLRDGDIVAVHSFMKQNIEDVASGVVVHMFRFDEQEKIAEFWDIAQFVESPSINENGIY